jgi:hypothetical protein
MAIAGKRIHVTILPHDIHQIITRQQPFGIGDRHHGIIREMRQPTKKTAGNQFVLFGSVHRPSLSRRPQWHLIIFRSSLSFYYQLKNKKNGRF